MGPDKRSRGRKAHLSWPGGGRASGEEAAEGQRAGIPGGGGTGLHLARSSRSE